ncbi:MAG: type I polyketide synthase [Cyanobacteria bacterium J06627_32]
MESIAIVGIGCRFPQANSPETFWQLLSEGRQAVTAIPSQRWPVEDYYDPQPQAAGKMNSRKGGFLDNIDRFDAAFFGISAEEAQHIDPQQRLFLEVAWEALEHAGIPPMGLSGSATGVFSGLCTIDYHRLLYRNFSRIGPHSGTGTTMSITANRLSYLLDLRGPSMAVDAACSSSLVAVHLACQSLQSKESNLGIAGGVNLILSPDSMISSAQTGLLSAQGACRPFDAEADGYVRGEGCGVVVLKRLTDAMNDGDNVLALIRGSAINQDGLSNSLTAPNGLAQQALIQRALEVSGITAQDIDYVEAHAVGTPLGDAIEFRALKQALAAKQAKRESPCALGSVKSNIGHLEAASGMAALIKVVLSLQHGEIPPQLNFEAANNYVDLEASPFEILPAGRPWPRSGKSRFAGVSTFGFGGTNAHLIMEEAPLKNRSVSSGSHRSAPSKEKSHHILALSAKSPSALRSLANYYVTYLQRHHNAPLHTQPSAPVSLPDLCFSANTGRSHFAQRLCLVSHSLENLQRQLAQFAEGEETLLANQFMTGRLKGRKRPKVVFHFPEPTTGTLRLGKVLYQTQPYFRAAFEQCTHRSTLPLSFDLLFENKTLPAHLSSSVSGRIAGFCVSYALATMWQQWGVRPAALKGEGLGEYVAACAAGMLTVDEVLPLLSAPLTTPVWSAASLSYRQPTIPLLSIDYSPLLRQAILSLSGALSDAASEQIQNRFQKLFPLSGLAGYDLVLPMGANRPLSEYMTRGAIQNSHLVERSLHADMEIWPQLLSQLGDLFIRGIPIDWQAFDQGYARERFPLPTYPFERSHHWFVYHPSEAPSLSVHKKHKFTTK